MNIKVISIDLAKNIFQVCAMTDHSKVVSNEKVTRGNLLNYIRQYEPTKIAMEACYSSNPWGRLFQELGHEVILIPPSKVKPFVQGNKNDANDAVAIAEASLRPKLIPVPVKTIEQQDVQTHQRIRERLIKQRTALINQIRGLLAEYHVVCAKQPNNLRKNLPLIIEEADQPLTTASRALFNDLYRELCDFDDKVNNIDERLKNLLATNDDYRRIQEIPGIGPVIAAATIAAIGTGKQFKNGREFSAWLGLAPKHSSSGDHCKMGPISKKGNTSLRTLIIHGARTVMNWCGKKEDTLSMWIKTLRAKKPASKVIVALANKLARVLWAVLSTGERYNMA